MEDDFQEIARMLLAEGCRLLLVEDEERDTLPRALALMDKALVVAPVLRPYAWARGFALHCSGRYEEAAAQFRATLTLDPDDVEPYLWRCVSEAQLHGWERAARGLNDFDGWDRRPCMAEVLNLFRGEGSMDEVLRATQGDHHAAARASFSCALYFHARGEDDKALALLTAVVDMGPEGGASDDTLRGLARCHLRHLQRRVKAGLDSLIGTRPDGGGIGSSGSKGVRGGNSKSRQLAITVVPVNERSFAHFALGGGHKGAKKGLGLGLPRSSSFNCLTPASSATAVPATPGGGACFWTASPKHQLE